MADIQTSTLVPDIPMAPPPFIWRQISPFTLIHHYFRLIQVLMAGYRAYWFYHVFFGMVLPLGLILFFKLNEGTFSTQRAIFLLSGDIATSIAYGPTTMLIGRLGWAKESHEFDYWAVLPIPKLVLLLSMISVFFVFALPGLAATYIVGSFALGLPLIKGLVLLPLAPLGILSMTGFGAFLGVMAKDGETSNVYGNALMGFVTFLSPMIIPFSSLPLPLRIISLFVPTTYVADAFRNVLGGSTITSTFNDILVLVAFATLFLFIVHRKLDWRSS